MDARKLLLATAEGIAPTPFEIPGARGEFRIRILNEDAARGLVTSIVHLPPGGRIPAHFHRAGAEMHYVLDGDLVEAGEALGPGAFITCPAGVVHGPHESRNGARVLTVQSWQSHDGRFDFHLAEGEAGGAGAVKDAQDAAAVRAADDASAEGSEGNPRATEQSLGKGYG
jgi:quercetin dioxygenase-like cupin family protein